MSEDTLLPVPVRERLADFLKAGGTGSFELHINGGSIQAWKVIENGRLK